MATVFIDTVLAQHDINRINTAITNLEQAQQEYTKLIADITNTYKGPAADELVNVINSRITSPKYGTKAMIAKLTSSRAILQKAINTFKSYDDNMLNLMK